MYTELKYPLFHPYYYILRYELTPELSEIHYLPDPSEHGMNPTKILSYRLPSLTLGYPRINSGDYRKNWKVESTVL